MVSCGMQCIKYMLFTFNSIFTLLGMGLIGVGALSLYDMEDYLSFLNDYTIDAPIILIVSGGLIFIVAFFGCYGAIKERYNMLFLFALFLLLVFILELAVVVTAIIFKGSFTDFMKEALKASIIRYNDADSVTWNSVQSTLKCCGIETSHDWNENEFYKNHEINGTRPGSCCEKKNEDLCFEDDDSVFEEGCFVKLEKIIRDCACMLIIVGMIVAIIEMFGIIMACVLAVAIKKEKKTCQQQPPTKVFVASDKQR